MVTSDEIRKLWHRASAYLPVSIYPETTALINDILVTYVYRPSIMRFVIEDRVLVSKYEDETYSWEAVPSKSDLMLLRLYI